MKEEELNLLKNFYAHNVANQIVIKALVVNVFDGETDKLLEFRQKVMDFAQSKFEDEPDVIQSVKNLLDFDFLNDLILDSETPSKE